MFGCEETRRYIDAWVDGELDPGAALHVEGHVNRCAECREELEMLRLLKRSMASLRETHAAPAALRTRIAAALEAADQEQHEDARVAQKKRNATGFMLASAALAGLVLAAARNVHLSGPVGLEVANAGFLPPVLEDIARRHARELPAEVQGGPPEQVTGFFRGRVDVPVRPVAFRGVPSQLVGARISNVRDQVAAALYYDVGGRRMTVFVFDGALVPRGGLGPVHRVYASGNVPVYVGAAHGYTVAFTEHNGVGYALASDLPPQDAMRIVEHVDLQ